MKIGQAFFILFFSYLQIQAQDGVEGGIEGTIKTNNESGSFYSVLLYDNEMNFLKGAITDSLGHFEIKNLEFKDYVLTTRAVGLEEYVIARFSLSRETIIKDFGIINISNLEGEKLDEVVIVAEIPKIKRTNEKIVVSISNSILAEGNSIIDILNYIPTVSVDPKGQITINRQGGIFIYIDGKSQSRTQNASDFLENLDPRSIDKIEVYPNPPARFDASGSSVINIITIKKKKTSDVNSSYGHSLYQFNGNVGEAYQGSAGANLYYTFGKVNTYGQISFRESLGEQFSENSKSYLGPNLEILETGNFQSLARSIRYSLGFQMDISEKEQISGDFRGLKSIGDDIPTTTNTIQEFYQNSIYLEDSTNLVSNQLLRGYEDNSIGLSYWFDDKSGVQRDVQVIYSQSENINNRTISSAQIEPLIQLSNRFNNYESFIIRINNLIELNSKTNFGFGANFNKLKFEENLIQNQEDSDFNYSEEIFGGYGELSGKVLKNVTWQVGGRLENTKWNSKSSQVSQPTKRNYINFFPSFSMSIPLDSVGSQIGMAYSRRITRPTISELNPAPRINDQFSTQSGNVSTLLPRLFNNFDVNFSSGKFYLSAWYRLTKNQRAFVPSQIDGLNIEYQILSTEKASSVGSEVSYREKIGFWMPSLDFSVYHDSESLIDGSTIGNKGYRIFFNNNLNFKNDISGSFSYFYVSKLFTGYNGVSSIESANASLRWAPSAKNFGIGVRFNDIFNSNKFSFDSRYQNLNSINSVISGSREVVLSLTYKFKMGREFREKQIKNDSEKFRVN